MKTYFIKKLTKYTSTINGSDCICHPNLEDCVNKINELTDVVNSLLENYVLIPHHKDKEKPINENN